MKTIGIVSPSSHTTRERIENGIARLESLGYKVVYNPPKKKAVLPFHGDPDSCKTEEISDMFKDPAIDIVMARNGGYGTPRYVDKLDYQAIRENPKVFTGFSDVSLLLNSIYFYTGITTYHGPMLAVDFYNDLQQVHIDSFFKAINNEQYTINEDGSHEIEVLSEGHVEGILVGGNLSFT